MRKAIKIVIILALTVFSLTEIQAQSRKIIYLQKYNNEPYHFGFLLGINFMDYSLMLKENYQNTVHPKSEYSKKNDDQYGFSFAQLDHFKIMNVESYTMPGFSVGVIGDKRLGNYFNLRFSPTLSLSSKFVQYETQLYNASNDVIYISSPTDDEPKSTRILISHDQLATFLEFPLHIKYRSKRYNNIGTYIIAGVNPKIYLGSIKGTKLTNSTDGNGTTSGNEGFPAVLQIKRYDVAFEFGTGLDIYNQWFKMGVELKYSVGLLNVMRSDEWSSNYIYNAPLNGVRNKQLQLSFTFE